MAFRLPRNHHVNGVPDCRHCRCAPAPRLAVLAALVAVALTAGTGYAQEAAGAIEAGRSKPGLRIESVIKPPPVIVDPLPPAKADADVESGDPADGPKTAAANAVPRTFRVGLVPRGGAAAFLRALEPFRAAIAETLGRPAKILTFADFAAMIDAQALHRIDLGFYSASAYALAEEACNCLDPLVAPAAADGSMAFHGIIVARRQSGIASIDDLKGREIAAGAPESVGSRRVQMAQLSADGIDVGGYFSGIMTARDAVDAILMVRDDRADAAFAWSTLTGDASAGYSRGPLAWLVEKGQLRMDEIAIIWRSPPIAHAPVVVARSLPHDIRQALTDYFVSLADDDPQTYDVLERDYGGGYRVVKRQDYAGALVLARREVAIHPAEPTLSIPRARPHPPGDGKPDANRR